MCNVCKLKCSGNIDRWTVSWIRLEMWRLGNWISCRKELDFIKSQYQEHASACNGFLTLKEHFWRWNLKSEALSQMSVNWVRFPCCSAGPTSAALISSNISQNHSTPSLQLSIALLHAENFTQEKSQTLCTTQKYAVQITFPTFQTEPTSVLVAKQHNVAAKLKGAAGSRQSSGSTIPASQRPLARPHCHHCWWEPSASGSSGSGGLEVRTGLKLTGHQDPLCCDLPRRRVMQSRNCNVTWFYARLLLCRVQ